MADTTTIVSNSAETGTSIPGTINELVEALIFAAPEPLSTQQIRAILEVSSTNGEERPLLAEEIQTIVATLNEEYQLRSKPYRIMQIAGGYQFATLPDYAEWIGRLYKEQGKRKLSQSSVETLAIVAYRQPVSKPEIESIRGVNCDYVIRTLLEKDLVTIVGRAPTPGRPLLYGTTQQFLKHFGLNDISDLPRPREIEELLNDSRYESDRRMLEAQQAEAEKARQQKEEEFKSRLPHIPKRKPDFDGTVRIVPKKRVGQIAIRRDAQQAEGQEGLAFEAAEPVPPAPTDGSATVEEARNVHDSQEITTGSTLSSGGEAAKQQNFSDSEQASSVADSSGRSRLSDERLGRGSADDSGAASEEETDAAGNRFATETIENTSPSHSVGELDDAAQLQPLESAAQFHATEEPESPEQRFDVIVSVQPPTAVDDPPREDAPLTPRSERSVLPATEVPVSELPSSRPKTRWEKWKETIRGFLRQVFG